MLNTAIVNADHRMLWNTPGWLPEEIGIIVEQGQFFCYEGEDLKLHLQRGIHNITVYSLIGMTISIESSQAQKPHLVAMVNGMILVLLGISLLPSWIFVTNFRVVAHAEPTAPGQSQWHLFNDFLVRSVSSEEALSFTHSWKVPSVVTFQVKNANNKIDNSWKNNIDTSLLYQDLK